MLYEVITGCRFGSIAINKGYVTLRQVQNALAEQVDDYIKGRSHRIIGEILLENCLITEEQIESILDEMGVQAE